MNAIILEHVRGDKLCEALEKLNPNPDQIFRVTIEPEKNLEELDMPPEEMISDALISAVKKSEENCNKGNGTLCANKKESDEFFKRIWDDEVMPLIKL